MSGYNSLIESVGSRPIFASNVGVGEAGSILAKLDSGILICPNSEIANKFKRQLDALNKENVLIDNFSKPFTLSKFQSDDNKYDLIKAQFSLSFSKSIILTTPEILYTPTIDLNLFKENVIEINKKDEIDIIELEKKLVNLGYTKVDSVKTKGEFARRGDIIDIFNSVDEMPTRLDFFDTILDDMYEFDFLTFEKLNKKNNIKIAPNKLNLLKNDEKIKILSKINDLKTENNIFFDIYNLVDREEDLPVEFLLPFSNSIKMFCETNTPIMFYEYFLCEQKLNKNLDNIFEYIENIFKQKNVIKIYENCKKYLKIDDFLKKFNKNLIFFENLDIEKTELKNKINNYLPLNFHTINFSNFLNNLVALKKELSLYKDKRIYLCLSNAEILNAIKKIFLELNINFSLNKNSKGIILT